MGKLVNYIFIRLKSFTYLKRLYYIIGIGFKNDLSVPTQVQLYINFFFYIGGNICEALGKIAFKKKKQVTKKKKMYS